MLRAEDPMLVIELIRFWSQLRNFIALLRGEPSGEGSATWF
jgi:hypothetical protein